MAAPTRLSLDVMSAGAIIVAKVATSLPQLAGNTAEVTITWLVVLAFVTVGVALLQTDVPPANGWACLLVAASTVPGDLNDTHYTTGPWSWSTVGYVLEPVYVAAAAALVLRYPRARLTPGERVTVWVMLAVSVITRAGAAFTRGLAPDDFHRPAGSDAPWAPQLHDLVFVRFGRCATAALLLVVAFLLLRRVSRAHGLSRQAQLPMAVVGSVCATAAAADQLVWGIGPFVDVNGALVRNVTAALLPFALLADLLRRRAAEAAVSRHVLTAAMTGDLDVLQSAIRDTVRDPHARVLLPTGAGGWVDGSGSVVTSRDLPSGHRVVALTQEPSGDARAPVLVFDPTCCPDEALVSTVVVGAAAGLQNARLHEDLVRALADVQQSRERIVHAGALERRRVERDLHDGAQQQFLAVAATLAQAEYVDDDAVRDVVARARTTLGDALRELRDLARGIHPPALTELGVEAALIGLAQRCPVPARVRVDGPLDGLDEHLGSAVYFLVAEALTNVVRHAEARHVDVAVTSTSGTLTVTVVDDGAGGAAVRPGGGLAGLADRVAALGGAVIATDHGPGRGSAVTARLPLSGGVER